MDLLLYFALLVAVFVGGLLVGVGGFVCDEDEEWDDEATFTTSYPRRDR